MDAVVFMEAVKGPGEQPPPPPPPRERRPQGITANAAMIAGVGTLVLAIGVGVLIGRSGDNGSATAANAAPQIIKVGGGSESESTTPTENTGTSKKKKGGGKLKDKASASSEEGGEDAAAKVLKPNPNVDLPDSTAQVGEKCEKGTAGCSNGGEFDGSFFGE